MKALALLKRLTCWWFGCKGDISNQECGGFGCSRCGALDCDYAMLVGDTRHNRLVCAIKRPFRRLFPSKCCDCGKRYGDHEQCIPF